MTMTMRRLLNWSLQWVKRDSLFTTILVLIGHEYDILKDVPH